MDNNTDLTIEAIGQAYHAWEFSKELPCTCLPLDRIGYGCCCENGRTKQAAEKKLIGFLRQAEMHAEVEENSYQDEIEKRLYQVTHSAEGSH